VEASAGAIALGEGEKGAAGRSDKHPRDRGRWVAVLAEDVADAPAVPGSNRSHDIGARRPILVDDGQLGVVLDPGARTHGANEVVDLLARRPMRWSP
jgi:hypothetical protein